MARTALSTGGQVVIPKEIRDRCGWSPGTVLEVEEVRGVIHLRPASASVPFDADALFGCIKSRGPSLSAQEMDACVDQMFREEHDHR